MGAAPRRPAAAGRRSQPGGPRQAGPEALGGHPGRRHPPGRGASTRRPSRLPTAGPDLDKALGTLGKLGALPSDLTVALDAAYHSGTARTALADRRLQGQIAHKGIPAPIQATTRWPVERTHAWGNQFGKLRWCTERSRSVVEFWICLAHAIITLGRLIRQAWTCYRWATRPRRRP